MEKIFLNLRGGTLCLITLLAALSRLLIYPSNYAPIRAMLLFGAAYFSGKYVALLFPIITMWISDMVSNNVVYNRYFDHFVWYCRGFYWTYGSFILIGLFGFSLLKKVKAQTVLLESLSTSIFFFIKSNLGVCFSGSMYPKYINYLISCRIGAEPFFRNTLQGGLAYNGLLFGVFEFAQARISSLKIAHYD